MLCRLTLAPLATLAGAAAIFAGCADAPVSPAASLSSNGAQPAQRAMGQLISRDGGLTVYDWAQNVTWLANADFAATLTFGLPGINPSGSMDYATAVQWVDSLNAMDGGKGYLGHHNWTLPTTPPYDSTCSSYHTGSFGFGCRHSALGSLYYTSLHLSEPNTAVRIPNAPAGPFSNFQPYLYWSATQDTSNPSVTNGYQSFSFNTGFQGSNVDPNHLYVLPMINHKLRNAPPATGRGLQVNPDGRTVYDPVADVTWLADANLAATQQFGVAGIDSDGSMTHDAAEQWIQALNVAHHGEGYLMHKDWQLPPTTALDTTCSLKQTFGFGCLASPMGELFYSQLGHGPGQPIVPTPDTVVGPFRDVQPYLYWACSGASPAGPCTSPSLVSGFAYSFSFGDGFEGTDVVANELYVMVYYPDPAAPTPPPRKPPPPGCKGTTCF
jgi:hypothetical protein